LKRIVVVVKGEKIVFEGDNLKVDNTSSSVLLVRKGGSYGEIIAVFREWGYWREIRKSDKSIKSKILIRAKKPVAASRVQSFFTSMRQNDVVMIPSDFKIIVLNSLGEAKIL